MRKILLLLGLLAAAGQVWADALPRCKTRNVGVRVEKSPTPLLTPDTISYVERTPDGGIVYCQPPEDLKHPDGKYHWCNDTLVEPSVKNCNDVPKPPEDEDERPKEGGKDFHKEVPEQCYIGYKGKRYSSKEAACQEPFKGSQTQAVFYKVENGRNSYSCFYKNISDGKWYKSTIGVTDLCTKVDPNDQPKPPEQPKDPPKETPKLPGDSLGIKPGGESKPEQPKQPGNSGDTGGSDSGSAGGGNSAGGGGGGNGSSGSGGGSGGGNGSGKGNGEGEGEQSAFCRKFPDTVACMKPGNGEVDPFKVPGSGGGGKTDGGIGWRPDFFLPSGNACPADKVITVMGKPVSFSYGGFCTFLDRINPLVRASCMFIAGMLVIRSIKGK